MNIINLADYLIVSAILFSIGIAGVFINRKNIIVTLMCIELMLLAVNSNFVAFAKYTDNVTGQIFVFFILTVAALKTAVGLAILMLLFKNSRVLSIDKINVLQG